MKHRIRRRRAARESLERIALRIAEYDLDAAFRFIDAVEASLDLLAEMPEAGPRFEINDSVLEGRLLEWVIPRYRRYLLFYLFESDVVHLIDVIDGRSDYSVEDEVE